MENRCEHGRKKIALKSDLFPKVLLMFLDLLRHLLAEVEARLSRTRLSLLLCATHVYIYISFFLLPSASVLVCGLNIVEEVVQQKSCSLQQD